MATTSQSAPTTLQSLLRRSVGRRDRLYALVDAARDRELAFAARDDFGHAMYSLFEGELAEELEHVAPHLVPIDVPSGYVGLWAGKLGGSAGILLISTAEPQPLRDHLRRMFVVTDEEGREFSFRYYDPRVLRVYIPTCTGAEAKEFFGPVQQMLCEGQDAHTMLIYSPDRTGVQTTSRPLTTE